MRTHHKILERGYNVTTFCPEEVILSVTLFG
jgi:hypothetical protein